jgi:hypothetical protein
MTNQSFRFVTCIDDTLYPVRHSENQEDRLVMIELLNGDWYRRIESFY